MPWRLIFALSRYGGLRCPSEHLALKWPDIEWHSGRMTVHSPKTEHHPGGESRLVPIFPELRPYLEDAFELAKIGGSEYVIVRCRDPKVNLRKNMTAIIKRAGLQPWAKLFQNLRSTRETELIAEGQAEHKVLKWIGNSKAVAAKFYLQVTDADYRQAAGLPSLTEALHGALQQVSAGDCTEAQTLSDEPAETLDFDPLQPLAASCGDSTYVHVGDIGLEPMTSRVCDKGRNDNNLRHMGNLADDSGAARGAADKMAHVISDPDLAAVVAAWPTLSDQAKAGIAALAKTARG